MAAWWGQSLVLGRDRREYRALDKDNLDLQGYDRQSPQQAGHSDTSQTRQSFQDPRDTFTEEQMQRETARCLGCGACTTRCRFDAIRLERRYDGAGVAFEHLKPVVVQNILRRKARITARKVYKICQRK